MSRAAGRAAETNQAPIGRLIAICRKSALPPLIPIPEFPGFELPRRERFHAPLLPAVRRPVTEARGFLDLRLDDARRDAAPGLPRRLADHIDEFRLIGHGSLLAKTPRFVSR